MPTNRVPVRPVSRNKIYDVLDGERDYQQETHPGDRTLAEHAMLMEEYARKMMLAATSGDTFLAQKRVREIGALAIRAAEQHGVWAREYHVPESANVSGTLRVSDPFDRLAPRGPAAPGSAS
jgi:hypothetical protein